MNPIGRGAIRTEAMQWAPSCWPQAETSVEAWATQIGEEEPACASID